MDRCRAATAAAAIARPVRHRRPRGGSRADRRRRRSGVERLPDGVSLASEAGVVDAGSAPDPRSSVSPPASDAAVTVAAATVVLPMPESRRGSRRSESRSSTAAKAVAVIWTTLSNRSAVTAPTPWRMSAVGRGRRRRRPRRPGPPRRRRAKALIVARPCCVAFSIGGGDVRRVGSSHRPAATPWSAGENHARRGVEHRWRCSALPARQSTRRCRRAEASAPVGRRITVGAGCDRWRAHRHPSGAGRSVRRSLEQAS